MRKKVLGPVLLLLPLGLPLQALLADDLPKPFSVARYQGMMDHSPFAVATAVVAPVAAPNFAKDLYIANAAHSKEDGDLVTIASNTDKNFKRYLSTNMPPMDGYAIVSIEWSDKVGATKVTISKDGQSATLGFNEALLRSPGGAPGANTAAAPAGFQPPPDGKGGGEKSEKPGANAQIPTSTALAAPPQSANPNANPNVNPTKPMPVPMVPNANSAARVRGVIPRNPGPEKPPGSQ